MLVEGAAELFLIPALIKSIKGIDLERHGISIIAIHGVHFEVYCKLFKVGSLEKKCAIVADADMIPSDANEEFKIAEDAPRLEDLRGEYVEVFAGATTFEVELVSIKNLPMFIKTTHELGAPKITQKLKDGLEQLKNPDISPEREQEILASLGQIVLRTAKRFGKARFAQVAARFTDKSNELPQYIEDALNWLSK